MMNPADLHAGRSLHRRVGPHVAGAAVSEADPPRPAAEAAAQEDITTAG